MMDDRALLEAAARAAGIKFDTLSTNGGPLRNTGFDFAGNAVLDWHNGVTWNPLRDDGDAFRLALKMEMDVFVRAGRWSEAVCPMGPAIKEPHGVDPYAATRRAIVRAAAAMAQESV